ncbi:hypothetical protein ABFX02_06G150200 [Erythranthe guttata]
MMMNQGETADSISSLEKQQKNECHQVHATSYFSPSCAVASWNTQMENNSLRENGVLSNTGYNHDQLPEPTLKNVPDGKTLAPIVSTSSSGPADEAQGYSGYAGYPNTDPYGYNSTDYTAYYSQYQQQPAQYQQQQQSSQYQQPDQYQQQQQPVQYQQPQQQPVQYQQQQPVQYQQPQQQPSQYQQPQQSGQYQQPQQSGQYQQPQQSSQYQQPQQSSQYQQPQQSSQYQQPQQSSQYQQPQQSSQYQQPQQASQYQQPQQSSQYQQQPQQSTQSYPHHVGAYQNTGAPYQPLSSFQNTGSYAGPASYSSTYYNPGDYQTSGSYTSGTYGTETNLWQGGQYATYSSNQYPNYTQDSSSAYSSTPAVATSQYQQHYKQWEDYYNQTQTEVSCAPGTENVSVPIASSVTSSVPIASSANSSVPSGSTGYTAPINQPVAVSGNTPEAYWTHGTSASQHDLPNSIQSHVPKPPEIMPAYDSSQNQQNSTFSQGSSVLYPASYQVAHGPYESSQNQQNSTFSQGSSVLYPASYQVSQGQQSSFQAVSQPPEPLDPRKANKLQIPTNPRIASNLSLGLLKTEKDSSMTSTTIKPSYVSVLMQKPNEKAMSHEEADSVLKPGTFPKSLRGYVERALARCKNDRQKTACQATMKEVITKATADGTLYTRDWDIEPLFPMPNIDAISEDDPEFPLLTSAMPKSKSPNRRAKSRWGPVPEEKMVDKSANNSYGNVKYGGWNKKQFSGGGTEKRESLGTKSSFTYHRNSAKNIGRPVKRQRFGDDLNAADAGESSSDSDKEQSLAKYYSAATAIADSPEEKKRRENRSKRFDKGHGNRAEKNNFRAKGMGAGNLYVRRASALVHSRTVEESGSRAVEDIDWNALTVKGTCQEIEKRYLRLTSAPDPATVRPEEVLEKALLMVQNSPKNYLYKCDQIKSIRQDLTVQHIRNELTVKVYETHGRLAIEVGDLPEYNQCQSQLQTLYAEGITGCHMEFAAYNLLCVILHSNNNRDLVSAMSRLPANAKMDIAVKHALSVRRAVTSGNYVMFFRLYKTAPNLNTFLMDLYVEKMRYAAVKCMSRSYRPTVPVSYLSQILGFTNTLPTSEANDENEGDGMEDCTEWLKAHGACVATESSEEISLDTKASVSSLYMPEPEDAVSHGDASLAVNDFLTRSLA